MAADIRLPSGYPAGKTGGQLKMKKKKRMSLKEKTQLKWGYFFIAPAIIGLVCFNFGPHAVQYVAQLYKMGCDHTSGIHRHKKLCKSF